MSSMTLFSADGEPCGTCGSPLAADQRYCLACGARRASARLPFLEILRGETETQLVPLPVRAAPGPVGGAVPPPYGFAGRAREYSGLIAGVGVLLLAMLIGVLLGSGVGDNHRNTALADQKPVVVSVDGAAAAPATTTAASTTTTPTDTSTGASSTPSASKKKKKAAAAKATIKPTTASPQKLKDLSKLSGKAYQKQVDKLGKNIAVGGKPPPKDNKPAAGGGGFQDIG